MKVKTVRSTTKKSGSLRKAKNSEQASLIKDAYHFIEMGKLRRAKNALARAVGWTEVVWNDCVFQLFPGNNVSDAHFWLKGTPDEQGSVLKLVEIAEGKKVTFWDIGANCGVYSTVIAKKCGAGSAIFAFEPNPEMFERLKGNLSANKLTASVNTLNIALGAETGTLDLHIYEGNLGRATIRTDDPKAQDRKLSVPVEPIGEYIAHGLDDSIKILKIDVEGYEDHVLMPWISAIGELGHIDYMLIEHTHRLHWGDDVLAILDQHGYQSVFVGEGNTLLASPDAAVTATS